MTRHSVFHPEYIMAACALHSVGDGGNYRGRYFLIPDKDIISA